MTNPKPLDTEKSASEATKEEYRTMLRSMCLAILCIGLAKGLILIIDDPSFDQNIQRLQSLKQLPIFQAGIMTPAFVYGCRYMYLTSMPAYVDDVDRLIRREIFTKLIFSIIVAGVILHNVPV